MSAAAMMYGSVGAGPDTGFSNGCRRSARARSGSHPSAAMRERGRIQTCGASWVESSRRSGAGLNSVKWQRPDFSAERSYFTIEVKS